MVETASIAKRKAQIRRQVIAAREAVPLQPRAAAATRLYGRLMHLRGMTIAGYLPKGAEADPRRVMAALSHDNRLCVPVVSGAGAPLRFREWWPGCATEPGAFGVPVPVEGGWRVPDVLIVPLVAFDAAGLRLGYGGGFYDRTLSGLASARTIGFALEVQKIADLPHEATDVPLDMVVTEARVYPVAEGNDART